MSKAEKDKQSKKVLIGFTDKDAKTIERAAKLCDTKRATFIQDAAVFHAEKMIAEASK